MLFLTSKQTAAPLTKWGEFRQIVLEQDNGWEIVREGLHRDSGHIRELGRKGMG